MKKIFAVLLSVLLALTCLVACGGGETAQDNETVKVGVLVVTTQSQWCNDLVTGVKNAVEPKGYEVIVSDSQVSIDNELSGMENLINSGCKAIVVNCMNAAGLSDLAAKAQEKGVYVIGWSDMLVNYNALVLDDYSTEAAIIVDAMVNYVTENALTDVEMANIWLADSANPDTTAGLFKAAIEKEIETKLVSKGVTVVNSQYAADTNSAMNTAEAILAANPNTSLVFCQSDEQGAAVAQVITGKGVDASSVMVCGLDGTQVALEAIATASSPLKATVYVDTIGLGQQVGNAINAYLADGTTGDVAISYTLVTAENASSVLGN